jgi:hypothetical protein
MPKHSQILKCIGGPWYSPNPDDAPLPTPNRKGAKTTLRTLATKVSEKGPRIEAFPELPKGAPSWDGRVQTVPKQKQWDYQQATNTLTEACCRGSITNIFCNGVVSNKDCEDSKQLGAASAILYHEGKEWGHAEKVLGETTTEADTMIRALAPGLDLLASFLEMHPAQTHNPTYLLLPSDSAVGKALNASPHEEQETAIQHLNKLGKLITSYPNLNIKLLWLPKAGPFIGFKRAKQLALGAIHTTNLANVKEPHTIQSQRKATKDATIAKWTECWHQSPCTSLAYHTALTTPPDGRPHPTFQTPQLTEPPTTKDSNKHPTQETQNKNAAKPFLRLTYSTLYRFITGHTFTSEYTQWFFSKHTAEQITCPCGYPIQTIEHVLLECTLYTDAHRKYLTVNSHPQSLPQLFSHPQCIQELLRFLEETGACMKPRVERELG